MKKFYAFFAAALLSVSMYAAAPTAADLAAEYDVVNNVVLCINPIEDALVCNDIRFVGTSNNWGKGEGSSEAWDNCEKFMPVPGFDGWYAAELAYSDGFEGKPLQEPTDRSWTWDYQCGDKNAWVHVGGLEMTISDGYADECNIAYAAPGAYIYQLKYWKKHKSPCQPVVKHNYTIKLYAPDACSEYKPAIIGDFNGWSAGVAMSEGLDDEFNTVYTYTFEDQEGHGFKIKDVADTDWTNELQFYVPDDVENDVPGYWRNFDNYELGATEVIVLDYSDNTKYRFAKCNGESPEQVIAMLKAPYEPASGIVEIVGSFDGWAGTAMTLQGGVYGAIVTATASDEFKFKAGTWDNELQIYNSETSEWANLPNLKFGEYWFDGADLDASYAGYKVVAFDFSDKANFRWTWGEGIENVTLTEEAQKVVIDGVLYIIRDNKMFNLQGAQVR